MFHHTQAHKLIRYNNSENMKMDAVLRREKYLILQGNPNFFCFLKNKVWYILGKIKGVLTVLNQLNYKQWSGSYSW